MAKTTACLFFFTLTLYFPTYISGFHGAQYPEEFGLKIPIQNDLFKSE
jgi:hypothetical protein